MLKKLTKRGDVIDCKQQIRKNNATQPQKRKELRRYGKRNLGRNKKDK